MDSKSSHRKALVDYTSDEQGDDPPSARKSTTSVRLEENGHRAEKAADRSGPADQRPKSSQRDDDRRRRPRAEVPDRRERRPSPHDSRHRGSRRQNKRERDWRRRSRSRSPRDSRDRRRERDLRDGRDSRRDRDARRRSPDRHKSRDRREDASHREERRDEQSQQSSLSGKKRETQSDVPAAKEVISSGSVVAQTIAAAEPVSVPTALPQLPGNLSLSLSLPIPGSSNAALRKVAQEEKKKLLWGSKDDKQVKPTTSVWESSALPKTVEKDKFLRLMGIKKGSASASCPLSSASEQPNSKASAATAFASASAAEASSGSGTSTSVGTSKPDSKDKEALLQQQEIIFRDLDRQYSMARMSTHTHRGTGLGFGSLSGGSAPRRN